MELPKLFHSALGCVHPERLLRDLARQRHGDEAFLFWGKAAPACWQVLRPEIALVIAPKEAQPQNAHSGVRWAEGEHPIPGSGSFRAGEALLDFFDALHRLKVKRLRVVLSGGASSLAWIRPHSISSQEELMKKLEDLYRRPLTIRELNQKRRELCVLKGGGAAHWLKRLAPNVRAQVDLISDVAPFGPEVVGSGPFWNERIRHCVLADNHLLVRELTQLARSRGVRVLDARAGLLGTPTQWAEGIAKRIHHEKRPGLLVWGGEPQVRLSAKESRGRGGRMSLVAAELALRLSDVQVLCTSTDGKDGHSGGSGVYWSGTVDAPGAARAIRRQDTGTFFKIHGALLPELLTGTNVQDVVLVTTASS